MYFCSEKYVHSKKEQPQASCVSRKCNANLLNKNKMWELSYRCTGTHTHTYACIHYLQLTSIYSFDPPDEGINLKSARHQKHTVSLFVEREGTVSMTGTDCSANK